VKRLTKTLFFLVVLLLAAGCEENGTNGNDVPADNEVWMQNMAFVPGTRTVSVGTTVVWINKDNVLHNVTSTQFTSSGNLALGATHSVTFDEAGNYEYNCTLHPGMEGIIRVED
jgi:plastocyanin